MITSIFSGLIFRFVVKINVSCPLFLNKYPCKCTKITTFPKIIPSSVKTSSQHCAPVSYPEVAYCFPCVERIVKTPRLLYYEGYT